MGFSECGPMDIKNNTDNTDIQKSIWNDTKSEISKLRRCLKDMWLKNHDNNFSNKIGQVEITGGTKIGQFDIVDWKVVPVGTSDWDMQNNINLDEVQYYTNSWNSSNVSIDSNTQLGHWSVDSSSNLSTGWVTIDWVKVK